MLSWYFSQATKNYIVTYQRDRRGEVFTLYIGPNREKAVKMIVDTVMEWDGDTMGLYPIHFEGEN